MEARMADLRFVNGGKMVGRDEAARCAVLVAGTGITEPSTVHAFSSEEAFRTWAAAAPAKKRLLELDALIARARAGEGSEPGGAERCAEMADRALASLYEAGERFSLQPNSEELLRKATANSGATPARLASLLVLFDAFDLGGGWRPVSGVVPHLDWIGFDDRTSSAWLAGAGVLGQHARFEGQRLYLLGVPWTRVDNLRQYGFDNRASSAAVL
jgi:hypothetical protein